MKYEVVTELNQNDIFKVAHKFTSLKGSEFNPIEIDFLFSFITQIEPDDEVFKEYRIDVDTLKTKMGRRIRRERVAELFDSLIGKYISSSNAEHEERYSIFDSLGYNGKEYKVKFSSEMKSFFLKIKPYTMGYLSDLFKLKSAYTKKIYLLCSQWKKAGSFKIKVDKLMEDLQVSKSLKNYADFKRKVLKVAEKNMIEKSKIYFEYEEIKKGRKVNEIVFIIKNNPKFAEQPEEKTPQLFAPEPNKFEQYKYKKIQTADGEKEINFIEDLGDFLKVYFVDGGHAQIKDLKILKGITK